MELGVEPEEFSVLPEELLSFPSCDADEISSSLSLEIKSSSSPEDDEESDPQAEKEIKHPKKTPKNPILRKFFSVMG